MKTIIHSTIFLLLAFAASTFAQQNEAAGPGFGNGTLPDVLQPYDLNTNGVLEVEERQAMVDARRNVRDEIRNPWDANGDGRLDADEREAARNALRADVQQRRNGLFDRADANGDDELVLDEFAALPPVARLDEDRIAAIFDRLDADDDGVVVLEEFLEHIRNRHGAAAGGNPGNGGPPDNPGPPINAGDE